MDDATARFTHVDESGAARMVDVSGKDVDRARSATATGRVLVSAEVVGLLRGEGVPKGDALGVARVAGIMARQADARPRSRCATRSRSPASRSTSRSHDDARRRSPRRCGPPTAPASRWRR